MPVMDKYRCVIAGSDSLAGGCSPRVERVGQESLAEVLDHPSAKDAEKLMETVVKASNCAAAQLYSSYCLILPSIRNF